MHNSIKKGNLNPGLETLKVMSFFLNIAFCLKQGTNCNTPTDSCGNFVVLIYLKKILTSNNLAFFANH